MMRRFILASLLLVYVFSLHAAPEISLVPSVGWTYDTNVFSDPLPTGYEEGAHPAGGEFLKRQNIALSLSSDFFFVSGSRFGLSLAVYSGFPYHSTSIIPEGNGYDWEYAVRDSLKSQHVSFFISCGPVFRYSFGSASLSLPIRFSVGSYDWFTSGVVIGVHLQPTVEIDLSERMFLSFSLAYDAHLMKFLFSMRQAYAPGYIMLTAGAYCGVGFRFGGQDA